MKFGFIKVAAATINIKVADCIFNSEKIVEVALKAEEKGVNALVFPELSITGYTCGDLFLQSALISSALERLKFIAEATKETELVFVVGLPIESEGKLYNCGAVLKGGKVLGVVPKSSLPNYNEFYEKRHFEEAFKELRELDFFGEKVPFGTNIIFCDKNNKNFKFAVELCEDLWTAIPPSSYHTLAGATVILNLSAGNEITGKANYRKSLVSSQSAKLLCGYAYACAGEGESTTDVVFSAHNLIAENGRCLAESGRFKNEMIIADIDVDYLVSERRKNTSYHTNSSDYIRVYFEQKEKEFKLDRKIDGSPFVPADEKQRNERCEEIMSIQAYGLKKRIEHIGCQNVVVGISGGLDSTQALLVAHRAFEILGLDTKGIITVTMPCFGTTDRTYNNAVRLCQLLNTTLIEINIKEAVMKHFEDIGHNPQIHDLTYENSQARERTQILMDIASRYNGFVIGTGDLSELALGFATYNGDHMSMYGVNASVPKTLIRYLIENVALNSEKELREVLLDVLDTPVSPELLPPEKDGSIKQVTEDIVGPYELHDFFLYNMMRCGFESDKIFFLAQNAFNGVYDDKTIMKWLKKFYWRFFSQQFKRSALPDGPKVGSVSLSPRGDWRMPSDACVRLWIEKLEEIEKNL